MLLGALALSCLLVWKIIMMGAISIFAGGKAGPLIGGSGDTNTMGCDGADAMASLAAQPAGLVAASNSLGAVILLRTPQSVIAGPYHRNIEGNLAWINTLLSSAPEAEKILKNVGATLLAFCPADGEEQMFAAAAPQGLASQLVKGDIPSWLEPVSETMDKPLRLFKVMN